MFCPSCGKEVPEGSGFCPSCGEKIANPVNGSMKDRISKAAETVTASAKSVGEKVNEATNGKAGNFAQTAQETAKNFSADVKQAVNDKDASGFFKKNKYRNVKIVVGIIAVIVVLCAVFSNKNTGGRFEIAKEAALESVASMSNVKSAKSANAEYSVYISSQSTYHILVSVKVNTYDGDKGTVFYYVDMSKNNDVTYCKEITSVIPSDSKFEKEVIEMNKERMKELGN